MSCGIHHIRSDGLSFDLALDVFPYAYPECACTTSVRLLVESRILSTDCTRFPNFQISKEMTQEMEQSQEVNSPSSSFVLPPDDEIVQPQVYWC